MDGCASGRIDSGKLDTGRAFDGSYVRSYKVKKKMKEKREIKETERTFLMSRSPLKAYGFPGSWTGKREYPLVRLEGKKAP
jgi:hypothetical protein